MRALLLIELDMLWQGAGAAMIRLAARARTQGVAPIAAACFLHDARPTFAEALESCVLHGATEVVLVPYALTVGPHDRETLKRLCAAAGVMHPGLLARLAEPLSDHPAVMQLVMQRASEADYVTAHPFLAQHAGHREDVASVLRPLYLPYPELPSPRHEPPPSAWRPMHTIHATALLLAACGPLTACASRPLYAVAEQIRRRRRYAAVRVCMVEDGSSEVVAAIDDLVQRGIRHALTVPCTLQNAAALTPQLAADTEAARARHADLTIVQAEALGYDRRLVDVLADRVTEAISRVPPAARSTVAFHAGE